jgi:uncharacterized protein (TIGR00369 family)
MSDKSRTANGAALIDEFFQHSPFGRHVGLELESVGEDRAEVTLPYSGSVATAGDIVHGGAISTLIDVAATAASWAATFDQPPQRWGTVSLSVNFVRPARADTLTAIAEVVRRGGSLCFSEVKVSDTNHRLIAHGLVTYRLG